MKIFNLLFLSIFFYLATFSGCPGNQPPAGFGITVRNEKLNSRSNMIITGKLFTPNTSVPIAISNFPRKNDISRTANVDGSGNFTLTVEFEYVTVRGDEEFPGDIQVSARDNTTGFFDAKSVSSAPYLIIIP